MWILCLIILLCYWLGNSRAKRNYRSAGSQRRSCEFLINKNSSEVFFFFFQLTHLVLWYSGAAWTGWPWGYSWDARGKGTICLTNLKNIFCYRQVNNCYFVARICMSLVFLPSVYLQGSIGKAGAPGEVGTQGYPVSMTFNLQLSKPTLIGCTWVNPPGVIYCSVAPRCYTEKQLCLFQFIKWIKCRSFCYPRSKVPKKVSSFYLINITWI